MNEHKNIITIEDEIKEFSDKPVKSSALFNALKEKGVPDSSEASAGDVLSLDEDKKPTWAEPSGGGMPEDYPFESTTLYNDDVVITDSDIEIDLSSITSDPSTWTVKIDGVELTYTGTNSFEAVEDDTVYGLWEESGWWLEVWDLNADTIKPGTYRVQILGQEINDNFREGVEACAPSSNVPNLPDPSEDYAPKYMVNRRGERWAWQTLRPEPINSMPSGESRWIEGSEPKYVKFPGSVNGGNGDPRTFGVEGVLLTYDSREVDGNSHWGIYEITTPASYQNDPDDTSYSLKLVKKSNGPQFNWVKDS